MTRTPVMPVHVQRDRFDPVAELDRLRAEQPVTQVTTALGFPAWLVTRYQDIRAVLGDATRFSNATRPDDVNTPRFRSPGFLLGYDPPEHTRLRRMLTPEFTVKRIRRMEPRIATIVTEHLDTMEQVGPPVDLVSAFALPIPSLVICELLGVPYDDREDFQRRSKARLDMSKSFEERVPIIVEARAYMSELVARQRAEPGEDMLGMLVREHGAELTDEELTGIADLLLLAGHETTSNMLGLGAALLLQQPAQLALLRADPGRVDAAVEELLRYLSIVHTIIPRTAVEDVVIAGQPIKAGEIVICSLPSANRDDVLGARLDQLDIARRPTAHLAFGHGIHHCLGAPLARMEMRIAYPALLGRFPNLRLAVPIEDVPFRPQSVVYGVAALPVSW